MNGIRRFVSLAGVTLLTVLSGWLAPVQADEAQWIWSSTSTKAIPAGESCFFRRPINLRVEAAGSIEITADDEYELFVNGRKVGSGKKASGGEEYDVTDFLNVGRNVIAIRVTNRTGNSAGLAARVTVQPKSSSQWFYFNTDASWKCSTEQIATWQTPLFNDSLWGMARSLGIWGETMPGQTTAAKAPLATLPTTPPGKTPPAPSRPAATGLPTPPEEQVASQSETGSTKPSPSDRFDLPKGFTIEQVANHAKVGSVIAMAFNEFGHIIVSQEQGPLLLIIDRDGDGTPDDVRTYCDAVKSCQGILPLNGEVFVTGIGPDGEGLYRLRDEDRNGILESVKKIVSFTGQPGEHGPHGLTLGVDGMIYIIVGNHTQAVTTNTKGQTFPPSYEGDLVERYEDPAGHASGVKAPGGTVVRTNLDGTIVERVAGGIRNAYDLVMHPDGGIFVHDSDMESDINTAWFRSTAVLDITEGGEYGWRSGWATWPEYYLDRLPGLIDTGRGSPTGAICYEHYQFPVRYHNTMFLADWSEGKILSAKVVPEGASYRVETETFLKGKPLNVTDLAVSSDGALYFCTGGRGTAGGIYRVAWDGEIPERMSNLGTGIARAVRQPQITSAWGRQEVAAIKKELGDQWNELVAGVAYSTDNPPHYRTRAMDLMQLFGPVPSEDLLIELAESDAPAVRAKAAFLLGLHAGTRSAEQLEAMLQDDSPRVQRAACEAILRSAQWPQSAENIVNLLDQDDRTLAFVARRVLERLPIESWKTLVAESDSANVRSIGALAMINADPSESMATDVLQLCSETMTGFLTDAQFVDVLRVCQVALHRSLIEPTKVTTLRDQIAEEFPAGDPRVNRELIRVAAYLDADEVAPRALKFINSDAPKADRTLVAMYMQFLSHDWTAAQRFEILKYYEAASLEAGSGSLPLYMMAVTKDFAESFSSEDATAILQQGDSWPNAALAAIYQLPRPVDAQTAETLRQLDRRLIEKNQTGDVYKRLRTGIVAMLSMAQDDASQDYLREIWRKDPERREIVALGLSQNPDGDNWDYLVRSLNIIEGENAMEVIRQLKTVRVATDDPVALRQLILIGLRAEADKRSSEPVDGLLKLWTGIDPSSGKKSRMSFWQDWFAKTYHDRPEAVELTDEASRWDLDELVRYIESNAGRTGNREAGQVVFESAQCASCHRFGDDGEAVGPDLTAISRRFTRREVLESILYPSHVISDQYMSRKVLLLDGMVYIGIVTQDGKGYTQVRDSKNKITRIDQSKIDQILPNNSSVMPSGLLDNLSLKQISDLMAYLGVLPSIEIATRP